MFPGCHEKPWPQICAELQTWHVEVAAETAAFLYRGVSFASFSDNHKRGIKFYPHANIWGILMASMLPYTAAPWPWILWVMGI
jgi:hypothetical protein